MHCTWLRKVYKLPQSIDRLKKERIHESFKPAQWLSSVVGGEVGMEGGEGGAGFNGCLCQLSGLQNTNHFLIIILSLPTPLLLNTIIVTVDVTSCIPKSPTPQSLCPEIFLNSTEFLVQLTQFTLLFQFPVLLPGHRNYHGHLHFLIL